MTENKLTMVDWSNPTIYGYHTPVTEMTLPDNIPALQMFLLDPKKLFDKSVYSRMNTYKSTIEVWKMRNPHSKMFVHGSYSINLSKDTPYSTNAIRNQLKLASQIDASGVVIHCGKRLKDTVNNATERFINNVSKAMDRATIKCPLIIETCVGCGTELFASLEDFTEMMNKVNDNCKDKVGICVDTAHIWGAGYEPIDFLISLPENLQKIVKLIHFNDSKVEKGSNVDRHAPVGEGKIGYNRLKVVADWAKDRNIPMIAEW